MSAPGLEFSHVMVYVTEVKRSLEFYQGKLGFQLIEEMAGYARLRSPRGTTSIALHELNEGRILDARTEGVRLYFEIENLDEYCAELASKGVEFLQMPQDMEWGWRHAYLYDPDGHEISLYWAGEKRLRRTN